MYSYPERLYLHTVPTANVKIFHYNLYCAISVFFNKTLLFNLAVYFYPFYFKPVPLHRTHFQSPLQTGHLVPDFIYPDPLQVVHKRSPLQLGHRLLLFALVFAQN